MRKTLIGFLLLNLVFEGWIAVVLISAPFRLADFNAMAQQWSVHYGFAALAMATAVFWALRFGASETGLAALLGILTCFHLGLTVSSALIFVQAEAVQATGLFPVITHGLLLAGCIFFYLNADKCVVRRES